MGNFADVAWCSSCFVSWMGFARKLSQLARSSARCRWTAIILKVHRDCIDFRGAKPSSQDPSKQHLERIFEVERTRKIKEVRKGLRQEV